LRPFLLFFAAFASSRALPQAAARIRGNSPALLPA